MLSGVLKSRDIYLNLNRVKFKTSKTYDTVLYSDFISQLLQWFLNINCLFQNIFLLQLECVICKSTKSVCFLHSRNPKHIDKENTEIVL